MVLVFHLIGARPAGFLSLIKCSRRIVRQYSKLQSLYYTSASRSIKRFLGIQSYKCNIYWTKLFSTLYVPGHCILTSEHGYYRLQVLRYMHTHMCLVPVNITCTPLEQLLLKQVTFWRRWCIYGFSQAQLHLNWWPLMSFACQHIQDYSDPYWFLAASFYPNYQLKCYNDTKPISYAD